MPTVRVMPPNGSWTKDEKSVIVEKVTDAVNAAAFETGKGDIKQFINVEFPQFRGHFLKQEGECRDAENETRLPA